jgi:hypothetical protein
VNRGQLFACAAVAMSVGMTAASRAGQQDGARPQDGHVIVGRVVDPLGLHPEDAALMLGVQHGDGFVSFAVPMQADGSFVTPRVQPGTYVLEVVRTPNSPKHAETVVGFQIVRVAAADVPGVTIAIQRDTAINGRFRMESDNPAAPWPPQIVVNAYLALDGAPLLAGTVAEGAPGGTFVLRNASGRAW